MPTATYKLTDGTDVTVDCIGSAPDPSLPVVVLLHGMGGSALDMTDPGNAYPGLSFKRSVFFPLYKDEGVHLGPPLLPAARFYLDPVNPPASLTSWNAALKAAGFTTITYTQTSSTPPGALIAIDVAQLTLLATEVLMAGTFAGVSLSGLRVAFVCHSRGGLVARSFLGGAGANPALAGFLSLVTALITLHSPNTGSGVAAVAATVAGLLGRLATAFAGAGLPAGAAAATALSGLVLNSMRAELVPGSATLTAIAAAEPVAGVTYHTFGGISTDFARIWADVYTPDSTIPFFIPLVPIPLFHWGSTPVVVGVPVNIASFVPAVLAAPTPFVTEIMTVLAALAAATPDLAPGQGDLFVSDARARLPLWASHTTNFLNHLEALSDPTLQAQVVAILSRLRSPVIDFYAAIWEQRQGPAWVARHGMSSAQYQQTFDDLVGQGYRLVQVSGYGVGGQDFYAAIWEQRQGPPWVARHGMSSAQYQQTFDDLVGQGYRLVQVSGYGAGGQDFYAAIWEQRQGPPWVARHGMSSAQYQQTFDDLVGQGYRLVQVSGYGVGGQDFYAAIWEQRQGPPWVARHGMSSAQYQQTFDDLVGQGYRLVQVSGYGVGGQDFYAAIWEQRQGPPWVARHGMSSAQYQQAFDQLVGQGYRLVQVSGYSTT